MIRFMFHALNAVPTNEHNDVFCFSDVFFLEIGLQTLLKSHKSEFWCH